MKEYRIVGTDYYIVDDIEDGEEFEPIETEPITFSPAPWVVTFLPKMREKLGAESDDEAINFLIAIAAEELSETDRNILSSDESPGVIGAFLVLWANALKKESRNMEVA